MEWSLYSVAFIVVRAILEVCSLTGWLTFVVGFGRLRTHFAHTLPDEIIEDVKLIDMALTYPLWLFAVSAAPLHLALLVQIATTGHSSHNPGHILHAFISFLHTFYLVGAGSAIFILFLFVTNSEAGDLYDFPKDHALLMFYGCIVSIFFYWVSSWLWPLFLLKRQPSLNGYQELLQSGIS